MPLPHLTQALYRALEPDIDAFAVCPGPDPYGYVRRALDDTVERLVSDPDNHRSRARALFRDIRWCFPLARQARVHALIIGWIRVVDGELEHLRRSGLDANGEPARCPVFTRKGRQCERTPKADNGHCPSHQHLVSDRELQPA